MDGQNVRCFWSFVEALPILTRSSRLCRSVQETQVAWCHRSQPAVHLGMILQNHLLLVSFSFSFGLRLRSQVTPMRLLFDVVMAQNIWIFGYTCDQNNLHTGCVCIQIHIQDKILCIYIYIYMICAQMVFLEAGLKFPLSGISIYEFWSTAKHPFVLSEGTSHLGGNKSSHITVRAPTSYFSHMQFNHSLLQLIHP